GQVLTNWWEEAPHKDEEVIQNMDFFTRGCLQDLQNSYHEENLDQAKKSQEVELLKISTQKVEAKLNNVRIETCNVQYQLVIGGSFESAPNEEE
ncbi:hypothetical protein HAX54_047271, partial [Datura stramonium]|nr:hypothetical protein [Datura stramonium]